MFEQNQCLGSFYAIVFSWKDLLTNKYFFQVLPGCTVPILALDFQLWLACRSKHTHAALFQLLLLWFSTNKLVLVCSHRLSEYLCFSACSLSSRKDQLLVRKWRWIWRLGEEGRPQTEDCDQRRRKLCPGRQRHERLGRSEPAPQDLQTCVSINRSYVYSFFHLCPWCLVPMFVLSLQQESGKDQTLSEGAKQVQLWVFI